MARRLGTAGDADKVVQGHNFVGVVVGGGVAHVVFVLGVLTGLGLGLLRLVCSSSSLIICARDGGAGCRGVHGAGFTGEVTLVTVGGEPEGLSGAETGTFLFFLAVFFLLT